MREREKERDREREKNEREREILTVEPNEIYKYYVNFYEFKIYGMQEIDKGEHHFKNMELQLVYTHIHHFSNIKEIVKN